MIHEGKITKTNQDVMVGDKVVRRYNIIGTRVWIHDVYEPTGPLMNEQAHSTITTINGRRYGKIGTRPFNGRIPAGDGRFCLPAEHYAAQSIEAQALIRFVYPNIDEYKTCGLNDCEIETLE